MSLISTVKSTSFYKILKKEKDDYKTRRMVKKNKKNEYLRKLDLYEKSKNYIYDIFDYKKIIEERPDNDYKYTAYNGFYGLSYIIKRYTGYKGILYPIFLHHACIDVPGYAEFKVSDNSVGIVCSERLAKMVEQETGRMALAIGPSIMYAKNVLTVEEVQKIKNDIGKTLLIFPIHSAETFSYELNENAFIDYIEKVKKEYNFDTVLVSVYFYDILNGADKRYLDRGYKVVSSGHRNSRDFFDVQRTLIELSDGLISQGFTSGLAYGMCLERPICMYNQDVECHKPGLPEEKIETEKSEEFVKFAELFSEYTDTITDEQKKFAEYLWGSSKKRSSDELLTILQLVKKIEKTHNKSKKNLLIKELMNYK